MQLHLNAVWSELSAYAKYNSRQLRATNFVGAMATPGGVGAGGPPPRRRWIEDMGLGAEPDQDALAQSAWAARFNISPHPLRRGDSEAAERMIADDRAALLSRV